MNVLNMIKTRLTILPSGLRMVPSRTWWSSEGVKFEIRTQKAQFERFQFFLNLKQKVRVGAVLEDRVGMITSF